MRLLLQESMLVQYHASHSRYIAIARVVAIFQRYVVADEAPRLRVIAMPFDAFYALQLGSSRVARRLHLCAIFLHKRIDVGFGLLASFALGLFFSCLVI